MGRTDYTTKQTEPTITRAERQQKTKPTNHNTQLQKELHIACAHYQNPIVNGLLSDFDSKILMQNLLSKTSGFKSKRTLFFYSRQITEKELIDFLNRFRKA